MLIRECIASLRSQSQYSREADRDSAGFRFGFSVVAVGMGGVQAR